MCSNNEIMYEARMEELSLKANKLEAENARLTLEKSALEKQVNQLNQKLAKVIGVAQPYVPKVIMIEMLNEMISDVMNQLMAPT